MQDLIKVDNEDRSNPRIRKSINKMMDGRYKSPYPDETLFFDVDESPRSFNKGELLAIEKEVTDFDIIINGHKYRGEYKDEHTLEAGDNVVIKQGSRRFEVNVPQRQGLLNKLKFW